VLACAALLLAQPALNGQERADAPAREGRATQRARAAMVERQLQGRDIDDPRVLEVMGKVPRHLFVPERTRSSAYRDSALPIDDGQTISQPYIVALMTQTLALQPDDRVLEVGTGSGYQAAVLAELVQEVFTIEIRPFLHGQSKERLQALGYGNVSAFEGDGYFGVEQYAPFDHIMITAAVDHIPAPLLEQLAAGGTMILPLGNPFSYQNLVLVTKTGSGSSGSDFTVEIILGVLFVPMTGQALPG
jgi:protein-L-isoaspartate(D-aspartate) O-methyltransferase